MKLQFWLKKPQMCQQPLDVVTAQFQLSRLLVVASVSLPRPYHTYRQGCRGYEGRPVQSYDRSGWWSLLASPGSTWIVCGTLWTLCLTGMPQVPVLWTQQCDAESDITWLNCHNWDKCYSLSRQTWQLLHYLAVKVSIWREQGDLDV